jgi:uncharacterized protein (DUF305 family)
MSTTTAPRKSGKAAPDLEFLSGASWGSVVAIVVIVAALAGAIGWYVGSAKAPSADSVDVGFLRDMIDHHNQAVQMSLLALDPKADVDADTRSYAEEIIVDQRFQIGQMQSWLEDWNVGLGSPDRVTMKWLVGMTPATVATMPGMQSAAAMSALRKATGSDFEQRFLAMMTQHHLGGIDMATYAESHASQAKVKALATSRNDAASRSSDRERCYRRRFTSSIAASGSPRRSIIGVPKTHSVCSHG